MHRIRAWGLSAALAAGAGAAAPAADPAPSWFARTFGPAPAAKPAEPPPAPKPAAPPAAGLLPPEQLVDALRSEQEAYLRRLDVCTKLREVAARTNDDTMFEQADALEQQATTLYHQRTARLGVKAPRAGERPTAAIAAKPADTLDRTLGTGAATNPLAAAKPDPDAGTPATAALKDRFREVQP